MNAGELIRAVERVGGVLCIRNGRLHCEVPDEAVYLLPDLRDQRHEVAHVLQHLEDVVRRWVGDQCVGGWRFSSNPQILRRDFSQWSGLECSDSVFLEHLWQLGFSLDATGMVAGLALGSDVFAADVGRVQKRQM